MAPKLPILRCFAAPSGIINRIARTFSTTSSQAKNESFSFLNLDKERKPVVAGADRVRNFLDSQDKLQRKTETHQDRKRLEAQAMRNRKISEDYMSQMARKWHAGETYSPRDLNPHQINKYKYRLERDDIVDKLDLNPLDLYKNFSMISEFMTSAGNIRHSTETRLRAKNQRRMAKAIRRTIGMGIHPSIHIHPELLMKKLKRDL